VDEDGRNLVRLTNTPYDEKDLCWSSDGSKIVYATSDGHLRIINTDTKEKHQITTGQQKTSKITPSFSPDGKEIAYLSTKTAAPQGDCPRMAIFPNFYIRLKL